jgi:hypothetical protein
MARQVKVAIITGNIITKLYTGSEASGPDAKDGTMDNPRALRKL